MDVHRENGVAASADTTRNQKGERRRESVNPQIHTVRKATGREKAGKNATASLCHDTKSEQKRKPVTYNSMLIVGMLSFHPMHELSP